MQKPDARKKKLLRKGSFLLALFLFQTCLLGISAIGKAMAKMQALETTDKKGQMPSVISRY